MGHIKLWDSILDCPKVHRLSDRAFRVWIKALVTALRNGGRNGELPLLETMEFRLRMNRSEIEASLEELHQCGLIDPCPDNPIGGMPWRIHDWDEWQTSKDPTAAARQARWRERQALRNAQHNGVSHAQHNGVEGRRIEGKKNTPRKPPKGGDASKFAPPDWIPRKDWDDYIEYRSKGKRKPTFRALELMVMKLEKLVSNGSDPGEVMRESIANGWTGLFAIKKDAASKHENNGKTAVQQRPEETVGTLKRPNLPRIAKFEGINRYWDDIEAGRKPNPMDLAQ